MTGWKLAVLTGVLASSVFIGTTAAQQQAPVAADTATVVRGNTEFAFDLYRQLDKDKNLFFSPYSISTALAMTYGGARGETAREMAGTLKFPLPPERLHPAFADLGTEIHGLKPRSYKLNVANRLWGQRNYTFLPEFLALTEDKYKAGLKDVDFINATEEARKTINDWVEKQTNDKIKELLKPGILTVDTRLVLTNAIYFKAAWQRPFDPKATKPGPFKLTGGKTIDVPLMHHGQQRANFLAGDTFQALEIPYEEHDLSMVLFLPRKADGLAEFEKSLTAANVDGWLKKMTTYMVTVAMPRFKVTAEFSLNDVLKEMGMKLAIDPRKADFSGMTTPTQLHISHVVHKAFVDVNEAGTEAAASTAVVAEARSLPPSATFTADHPFVYLIRDNRTGSILFMGRLTNPN